MLRKKFFSLQLYAKIKREKDAGVSFKKNISSRKGVQAIGGASEGVTHSIKDTERYAFADWINRLVTNSVYSAIRCCFCPLERH